MNRAVACRAPLLGLLLLVPIPGCGLRSPAGDRADLLDTDRAFARRSVEIGAREAFREYLAEDALGLAGSGDPRVGNDAVADSIPETVRLTWEPVEGGVSGDMGWTWGRYQATFPGPGGRPAHSSGRYVNVWRRGTGGAWKVIVDIGTEGAPADEQPGALALAAIPGRRSAP